MSRLKRKLDQWECDALTHFPHSPSDKYERILVLIKALHVLLDANEFYQNILTMEDSWIRVGNKIYGQERIAHKAKEARAKVYQILI